MEKIIYFVKIKNELYIRELKDGKGEIYEKIRGYTIYKKK